MKKELTQAEVRGLAKEHFDALKAGTSMPGIRTVALDALLKKISPALDADSDYRSLFGVTKTEFQEIVPSHSRPMP